MQVKLTDEELQQHIEKALVASISNEARERMIADALKWLTTPEKTLYADKGSPLQRAVQNAVQDAASKWIVQELEKDDSDFSVMLQGVIKAALMQLRDGNYETIAQRFSGVLARALSNID